MITEQYLKVMFLLLSNILLHNILRNALVGITENLQVKYFTLIKKITHPKTVKA